LTKETAAGIVTEGPWSPPMQSMEILTVIVLTQTSLSLHGADSNVGRV
jgi:hypothetical protein